MKVSGHIDKTDHHSLASVICCADGKVIVDDVSGLAGLLPYSE